MQKTEFVRRFATQVRVRVDWEAFAQPEWTLARTTLALPGASERLWTPWYPNAAAGPPASDPEQWPLSVLDAAANRHRLGANEQSLDKHILACQDQGTLELPALALPQDRFLLLDGNHRVVAGAIVQRPVALVLYAMVGPPGARVLRDLPALSRLPT